MAVRRPGEPIQAPGRRARFRPHPSAREDRLLPSLIAALPLLHLLAATTPDSAARDSAAHRPRIWRQFPTIEVRAPVHDLGSSETVHLITPEAIQTLPVDNFADLVRTQAGVVADG